MSLNGFLIGTYAFWDDDSTMKASVVKLDLKSGQSADLLVEIPSEDTCHRIMRPGNLFMYFSLEPNTAYYRFCIMDRLRHERMLLSWQPPVRSARLQTPTPPNQDAPPFILVYRRQPYGRLRYKIIKRPEAT